MIDANDDTFPRIASIVRRTFRLGDDAAIRAATSSADIDGWDSLSHSILIMEVEEEFDLALPLDRLFALSCVGELVALIREMRSKGVR